MLRNNAATGRYDKGNREDLAKLITDDLQAVHKDGHLHAGIWIALGGEVREASRGEAIARLAETPHIILNAPLLGQRLGYPDVSGLDLLELFAFIHPARFAVPTVPGLARACGVEPPADDAEAAAALVRIGEALLERLADPDWPEREGAWTANASLTRLGWSWSSLVGKRLAKPERGERMLFSRLSQWEERGDRPQPKTISIPPAHAEARLAELTGKGSEPRQGQRAMIISAP